MGDDFGIGLMMKMLVIGGIIIGLIIAGICKRVMGKRVFVIGEKVYWRPNSEVRIPGVIIHGATLEPYSNRVRLEGRGDVYAYADELEVRND